MQSVAKPNNAEDTHQGEAETEAEDEGEGEAEAEAEGGEVEGEDRNKDGGGVMNEQSKSQASLRILNSTEALQTDKDEGRVVPAVVEVVSAIVEDIARRISSKEQEREQGHGANEDDQLWLDLCKQKKKMIQLVFVLLAEPVIVARISNLSPVQLAV